MEQWKSEDQKKKKTTVTTSESTVIAAATTTTKTKRKSLCLQLRSKMDDPDDIIYLTIPLCILFVALSYTTTLPNIITASTHPQQHITQQQQNKVASILYLLTILASTYIIPTEENVKRDRSEY
jgi:hypothetical protein